MYRQWDNEMMRMANGEIDNASGSASCTSIKNSSEDLELYFIVVGLTLHGLVLVFINYYFYNIIPVDYQGLNIDQFQDIKIHTSL